MARFRSNVKFTEREIKKFLAWVQDYIDHRGGMGNRIDAFDIRDKLIAKKIYLQTLKERHKVGEKLNE